MKPPIQRQFLSLLRFSALLLLSLVLFGTVAAGPVLAEVSQRQSPAGQGLYQSQHTLKDRAGRSWQVIAFRRVGSDGRTTIYLRLEGLPGAANLARNQPLKLIAPGGQVLEAADKSSEIFPDASPAPHLRQYDLKPILSKLDACKALRLSVPAAGGSRVEIDVPATVLQEWKSLAGQKGDPPIFCP
jgi:hypothetical protein